MEAIRLGEILARRALIDQVEMRRMQIRYGEPYNRSEHELTEAEVDSHWAADGKTRNYWYLLAREALAAINLKPLTPLPAKYSHRDEFSDESQVAG